MISIYDVRYAISVIYPKIFSNYYNDHYNDIYCNDLCKYDIKINEWNEMIVNTQFKRNKISYHTSCIYNNYLIIFGGKMEFEKCSNNLYIYNITNNEWFLVNTQNKPVKRYSHCMTILNDNLLIYGGIDNNNKVLDNGFYINMFDVINKKNINKNWIPINFNIGKLCM